MKAFFFFTMPNGQVQFGEGAEFDREAMGDANLHDVHTLEKNEKRLKVLDKAMAHHVKDQKAILKKV
jgi:hypothetical protein